jgi:thioredoxin 1
MAVEITDANFESLVKSSDKPVLIDFWAVWCGPCKMVAPVIEELAQNYEGKAIVGKLDVDNNPVVASTLGIRSIPTMLFFKNGELVDRHVGYAPKNVLAEKLDKLI